MDAGIDRIILFGPAGTGKTYAGLHFGDVQAGAHRLVCTDDMTSMDVTGAFMPDGNGKFSWVAGAGLKAWEAIDNYLPLATPNELKRAIGLALVGGLNMTKEIVRMVDDAEMPC